MQLGGFLRHLVVYYVINIYLLPRPRRGLRGIVFTLSVCLSVCVCVCPANILVFYFSAISRNIDLKFIHDTYRVLLNAQKNIDLHRSKSQGRYIVF